MTVTPKPEENPIKTDVEHLSKGSSEHKRTPNKTFQPINSNEQLASLFAVRNTTTIQLVPEGIPELVGGKTEKWTVRQ